jgi:hypothetical protein
MDSLPQNNVTYSIVVLWGNVLCKWNVAANLMNNVMEAFQMTVLQVLGLSILVLQHKILCCRAYEEALE